MTSDTIRRIALPLLLAPLATCTDEPIGPDPSDQDPPMLMVSQPVQAPLPPPANAAVSGEQKVVYVSLQAGMAPTGVVAVVRNMQNGVELTRPMVDGALDPVPIPALVGDVIQIDVKDRFGSLVKRLITNAPLSVRPIVVRTTPPRRKSDVPLNTRIVIVFSEPIDGSSTGAIQLKGAEGNVAASITMSGDGLRAELILGGSLTPQREYTLTIPNDVKDREGNLLQHQVTVTFTTGTSTLSATINTDQAATIANPYTGALRTMEMTALLYSDGSASGTFSVLYPELGHRLGGRITCLTVVNARTAWIGGVVDDASNPALIGTEQGWRIEDNGTAGNGTPDKLSLAIPISGSLGTARQFCESLPTVDEVGDEIILNELVAGEIVLRAGSAPLPADPNAGMSEIAFAAYPNGGIRVMRADGFGVRVLTPAEGDWNPAWSPDGKQIAFDRRDAAGSGDLWIINADGTGLRRLTTGVATDANPVWSPDGTRIAFWRDGGIWSTSLSPGAVATRLTSNGWHPSWSPDGLRIAFWCDTSGQRSIYSMSASGENVVKLTSDTIEALNPAWSPDGTSIVMQVEGSNPGVYVMTSDGSKLRRLTYAVPQTPTWSHDGTQILFEQFGLVVMNADGSSLSRRGTGFTPAWSPTGKIPSLPAPIISVAKAGGDLQSDTVGATLAVPLSVRLTRDDGRPVQGTTVFFQWREANQPITSKSVTTDAAGVASLSLTLGQLAGRLFPTAQVTNGMATSGGVAFTVEALAGNAVSLYAYTDIAQLAQVNTETWMGIYGRDSHGSCPDPACGNPTRPGFATWQVASGRGTLRALADTTITTSYGESFPLARSGLTASEEGQVIVTPSVSGINPVLTFTTTVVTRVVTLANNKFSVDTVVVPDGKTVGWVWSVPPDIDEYDAEAHNITFEDAPTPPTSSPSSIRGMFTRLFYGGPRLIRYSCTQHPTEIGWVKVQ